VPWALSEKQLTVPWALFSGKLLPKKYNFKKIKVEKFYDREISQLSKKRFNAKKGLAFLLS